MRKFLSMSSFTDTSIENEGDFNAPLVERYRWSRLAPAVKRNIEQLKVTQIELAEVLHVSKVTVGKWMRGEYSPNLSDLIGISDYIGCSLDDLIDRKPYSHPIIEAYRRVGTESVSLSKIASSIDEQLRSSGFRTAEILSSTGINKNSLSYIRNAKRKCPIDKACALADLLELPVDVLIGHTVLRADRDGSGSIDGFREKLDGYISRMDDASRYALLSYAARLAGDGKPISDKPDEGRG